MALLCPENPAKQSPRRAGALNPRLLGWCRSVARELVKHRSPGGLNPGGHHVMMTDAESVSVPPFCSFAMKILSLRLFGLSLLVALTVFGVNTARAQWLTQNITLQPGWNAVFLHVDASHTNLVLRRFQWNCDLKGTLVNGEHGDTGRTVSSTLGTGRELAGDPHGL